MSENVGSIFYTVDIETDKTLRAQQQIDQGFDKLQKGMDDTDRSAAKLGGGLSKLAVSIAAVVSAGAIREMAGLVQKYQEMSERVQMATSSQAEFETVQKRLLTTANGTYRSLTEAQELYIRTADSLRSLGYSTAEALDVTDSMAYAFVTNATSADRANAAISALSKSVNTGKVAADQWETITSAIPSVIDDIAASSGRTSAEIRKLGAEGKLTAQALTEGLRKSLDANAEAAGKMAANLTDAGVRTTTAITQVLVSLESQTGALQAVTDGIVEAANAVLEFGGDAEKMAAFLDGATTAATALASVIAGRLIGATAAYSKALLSQAAAAVGAARSAEANLRLAQAEAAAAANALTQASASEKAAIGLSTHAAAANTLQAAQVRAATATGALTAATATAATVARASTVAFAGLRTAMGFLGGPAGVIFLAATALYSFISSSRDAKPAADALTGSLDKLGTAAERAAERFKALTTGIEGLNKAELSGRKGDLEDQLRSAEGQLKSFQRQFDRGVGSVGQLEGARAAVEELKKALEKLNGTTASPGVSQAVSTDENKPAKESKVPAKTEAEKAAEAIRDQVSALELQAATLGLTADELEVYKLELAGATDEQIRAAQSALSAVAAYEQQTEAAEASAKAEAERRAKLTEAAKTVTPMRAAENEYLTDLAQYQEMLALKLISDQEYQALKAQSEIEYDAQRLAAQEAMFASMSTGNAMLMDGINALGASASTAFAGIISGSTSGEEAMRSLAGTILNSVISSIVEMGIAQVKSLLMGQTAAAAAAAAGAATAGALAAAYATPAALVSLASFGANAAPASAGIASTVALSQGLATVTGRALGGPVQSGGMYRVNEGGKPEIFNAANGQQYMMPNQRGEVVSNRDAEGQGGGTVVNVTVTQSAEKAGTVERRTDGTTEAIDIFVADIRGGGTASRTLEQTYGLQRQGQ
jgi:tape measure domain-containing protein